MCQVADGSMGNQVSHLQGIAAATMFTLERENNLSDSQLRVAFDGDAVLFSDESEIIMKTQGLDSFFEHEKQFANKPLAQVSFATPGLLEHGTWWLCVHTAEAS